LAANALANKKDVAVCMWDSNAAASAVLALAKDKRCQEEVAAQQCRVEADCVMAPVEPPDHFDTEILRIWAECTLRAAPLNAILAEIACNKASSSTATSS
jgi:hypothetical protein